MRILHCSDFHAVDAWYRWLARESDKYDLVCLTGDLLDFNPHRFNGRQIDRVVAHVRNIESPLAICSGNHDSVDGDNPRLLNAAWMQELRRPNLWLDGDRFEHRGQRFRIIPWMSPIPEAKQDEIWLIHTPPDLCATGITRGGIDWGDWEFGELCRNSLGPKLALSGHVHDRETWYAPIERTCSLNPGCDLGAPVPLHIIVDLERGLATFHRYGCRPAAVVLLPRRT